MSGAGPLVNAALPGHPCEGLITLSVYTKIRADVTAHHDAAEAIIAKCRREEREPTQDETYEAEHHIAAAKALLPKLKRAKADHDLVEQLRALGPDVGPYGALLDRGITGISTGYRTGASAWATRVAGQLTKAAAQFGVKALATGSIDVPAVVEPTVEIPSLPTRLLDLVPTRPLDGNEYSYPRQTVRTNNAATVADGATKPTSPYTFTEISDKARVVAHLSEPIPLRYFQDHADLESVLDGQMRNDLLAKVEALVANGTGTGEDWLGVLNVSGIQVQPYFPDMLTTLRRARTKLEVVGVTPTAFVLNPADVETLDLTTDANGRFYGAEVENLLGRLPRVPSAAVPAGTALLGDFRQARLFVRQEATLDVDRSGDLFDTNRCKLRCELRAGFGVTLPMAFVSIALTA